MAAGEKQLATERCPAQAVKFAAAAAGVRVQRLGARMAELWRLRFTREVALQADRQKAAEAAKRKAETEAETEAERKAEAERQERARLRNLRGMKERVRSPQERQLVRVRRILARREAEKRRRGPSAFLELDAASGAYRFSARHRRRLRAFLRRQMLRTSGKEQFPSWVLRCATQEKVIGVFLETGLCWTAFTFLHLALARQVRETLRTEEISRNI